MSVVKTVELIAQSPQGWEAAAKEALQQASKTLRGIKSIWVSDFQALVDNNQITTYRITCKISFEIEDTAGSGGR